MTLAEVCFSATLCMTMFGGLFGASTALMAIVQNSKETLAANQSLQERIETMRIANWVQITNPTYQRDVLLANPTRSSADLNLLSETLTIDSYPTATTPTVIRRAGSVTTLLQSNLDLSKERLLKFTITLNWTASKATKRARQRVDSVLIAKGGIAK